MKTSSDTKASSGIEAMRKRAKALQDRANGKGGGGKYDKLEEGKNYRRILPVKGNDQFFVELVMHYGVGNGKTVVCIGENKCPICRRFEKEKRAINAKYGRGDEKGKRLYRKIAGELQGKNRFMFYTYDPKANDNVVKVTSCGQQIMKPLLEFYFDEEECGDFTARKTGRDMIISRVGTQRDTEYTVRSTSAARAIDLETWKALIEQTSDTDGLAALAGERLSPEKIKSIMDGLEEEEEDEDSDSEEETDEEETDEDDAESEATDSDDDEEEEEEPPASTKAKLKAKASRR